MDRNARGTRHDEREPAGPITSLQFFPEIALARPLAVARPDRRLPAQIFRQALDTYEGAGKLRRPKYNLVLCGRGKKNWKSADLILAALYCLAHSPLAARQRLPNRRI